MRLRESFLDHHELLEICQFCVSESLAWPYVTVCWLFLYLVWLSVVLLPPSLTKRFNLHNKLYGHHYKISLKPLALLIHYFLPKCSFLIFKPLSFMPLIRPLPFYVFILSFTASFSCFSSWSLVFVKALLSMPHPCNDQPFLTTTHKGCLSLARVSLLLQADLLWEPHASDSLQLKS